MNIEDVQNSLLNLMKVDIGSITPSDIANVKEIKLGPETLRAGGNTPSGLMAGAVQHMAKPEAQRNTEFNDYAKGLSEGKRFTMQEHVNHYQHAMGGLGTFKPHSLPDGAKVGNNPTIDRSKLGTPAATADGKHSFGDAIDHVVNLHRTRHGTEFTGSSQAHTFGGQIEMHPQAMMQAHNNAYANHMSSIEQNKGYNAKSDKHPANVKYHEGDLNLGMGMIHQSPLTGDGFKTKAAHDEAMAKNHAVRLGGANPMGVNEFRHPGTVKSRNEADAVGAKPKLFPDIPKGSNFPKDEDLPSGFPNEEEHAAGKRHPHYWAAVDGSEVHQFTIPDFGPVTREEYNKLHLTQRKVDDKRRAELLRQFGGQGQYRGIAKSLLKLMKEDNEDDEVIDVPSFLRRPKGPYGRTPRTPPPRKKFPEEVAADDADKYVRSFSTPKVPSPADEKMKETFRQNKENLKQLRGRAASDTMAQNPARRASGKGPYELSIQNSLLKLMEDGIIEKGQDHSSPRKKSLMGMKIKKTNESLKALDKYTGGIASLMNHGGREAEHHQLLREYGFPSEHPQESLRYIPVVETETDDCGCVINNKPPWVVNEAGQHIGETHPEDSAIYKMGVSNVLYKWLEKAGIFAPKRGGGLGRKVRMRVISSEHAALGKPPKSKRGFRAF